jgi:hypothetical protein
MFGNCHNCQGTVTKEDGIRITGKPEPYVWYHYQCVRRWRTASPDDKFYADLSKMIVDYKFDTQEKAWHDKSFTHTA